MVDVTVKGTGNRGETSPWWNPREKELAGWQQKLSLANAISDFEGHLHAKGKQSLDYAIRISVGKAQSKH